MTQPLLDDDGDIETDCDDTHFEHKHTLKVLSIVGIAVVLLCGLYVLIDAIRHSEKRQVPGKLMLSRTGVDILWALLFFYMILQIDCNSDSVDGESTCNQFGMCFTLLFELSLMYFGGICWDMYFTLVNPFRKPVSDSWQLHLCSVIVSLTLSIIVYLDHGYHYRQDYQICWTKNTSNRTSPNNIIILYLPMGAVTVGGVGITIWAVKRLQQRMLEETFELRWNVIKRQIAIVSFFTINYLVAGCLWFFIVRRTFEGGQKYSAYGAYPDDQPFLLSVTIVLTVIFDVCAWIAKDSVDSFNIFVSFHTKNISV